MKPPSPIHSSIGLFLLVLSALPVPADFGPAAPSANEIGAGWKRAIHPEPMDFPRDHFSHPGYKTEWWYFTGNLEAAGTGGPAESIGFQFTLFRQGILAPGATAPASAWVARDIGFGHAALTFPDRRDFVFGQVLERGSLGSAEFPPPPENPGAASLLARARDWSVTLGADGVFHLRATFDGHAMDLQARPLVDPVLQGTDGLSQKSAGEGNASRYFSIPRLATTGTVTHHGKTVNVRGTSWLDREWASNQLGPEQIGWDWFALKFRDGRDLMVYQMRRRDGTRDPFSHGSLRHPDGKVIHLGADDYTLRPGRVWRSPETGGVYPVEWELSLPAHDLAVRVRAVQDRQELALEPVSYYEGAVTVHAAAGGEPEDSAVLAEGYMELTGYARPLEALRSR